MLREPLADALHVEGMLAGAWQHLEWLVGAKVAHANRALLLTDTYLARRPRSRRHYSAS